ncbi:MAG: argininosuccinate lyase [Candidatus Firestonebacteria bacterium]|nr:argininosuccinate lyase [Candidatus Firestonebacteria bacterium]
MESKLWGGCFNDDLDLLVEKFTESISFDNRLAEYDILGSIAHATMLGKCKIISIKDADKIVSGLNEILKDYKLGKLQFTTTLEDIHTNIEHLLVQRIGEIGKKLHAARSRNDQVALDIRLFLRSEINIIIFLLKKFQKVILDCAFKWQDIIMPGYTHLQRAQPILLSHHLLAYYYMLERDKSRMEDNLKRVNILPLGSAALSGTTYKINRKLVAELLNFKTISDNSIDSVSDRDFAIEFAFNASTIMMHLSRLSEELILWSTLEFGFINISDAFTTGSSIMPQKKNPDVPELVRGKTGRVYGNLINLLTMQKGLPLAYNKDMQEDKEPVFDIVDTVKNSLDIYIKMLPSISINKEKMLAACQEGFLNATDAADYLVQKGLSFREAHNITGRLVRFCIEKKYTLETLPLDIYIKFSQLFKNDIYKAVSIKNCVNMRNSYGGTSLSNVKKTINREKKKFK